MAHAYVHPEHLIHIDQIHWDEWISMVLAAGILAALVVGGFGFTEATPLLSDASLAP